MPARGWSFTFRRSVDLPPLFWIAYVRSPTIAVHCGGSVRTTEAGFLEGSWAGGANLADAASAATVFATGIILVEGVPIVVTPSQPQEGVYAVRLSGTTVVSNSLAGLLQRTGLALAPDFDYPKLFLALAEAKWLHEGGSPPAVLNRRLGIPTTTDTIDGLFYENFRARLDGSLELCPKAREPTFDSFADYRQRMTRALAQIFANGRGYRPVVALSAGYDSTAVAAVAARAGCRRAISFRTGRQDRDRRATDDSGVSTAHVLGLEIELFERMEYLEHDDLPEADFLAGGSPGEDVILAAFEPALKRSLLLTGHWGGRMWDEAAGPSVRHLPPPDLSGCSLTDFRLRTDFLHIPLPFFGNLQHPRLNSFADDADMKPYRLGRLYDRPIARRLAEEAGVPRGTFATTKVAVSSLLHRDGRAAFAPFTTAAIERFAAAEGRSLRFRRPFRTRRRHRAIIRLAHALRVARLTSNLEARRQSAVHFDSVTGTLLFRWAVSVVGPRYADSDIPTSER